MNSKKQKGTLSIAAGLVSLLTSVSLLSARKAHGETANDWLGSDDFIVMGALFSGSIGLLGAGVSLYLAGDKQDNQETITLPNGETPRATLKIEQNLNTAYCFGVLAAISYCMLSVYALLSGFAETPTPESHIGPHDTAQTCAYAATYGSIGLITFGWSVYSAYKAQRDYKDVAPVPKHIHYNVDVSENRNSTGNRNSNSKKQN